MGALNATLGALNRPSRPVAGWYGTRDAQMRENVKYFPCLWEVLHIFRTEAGHEEPCGWKGVVSSLPLARYYWALVPVCLENTGPSSPVAEARGVRTDRCRGGPRSWALAGVGFLSGALSAVPSR